MIYGHGWGKLANFGDLYDRFPDPLGIGPGVGLTLVIFAEVICASLVILGLYTRFALIPLLIDMSVVVFLVHPGDPWAKTELPLLFLVSFVVLLIVGPGWYSLDNIRRRRKKSGGSTPGGAPPEPEPPGWRTPAETPGWQPSAGGSAADDPTQP